MEVCLLGLPAPSASVMQTHQNPPAHPLASAPVASALMGHTPTQGGACWLTAAAAPCSAAPPCCEILHFLFSSFPRGRDAAIACSGVASHGLTRICVGSWTATYNTVILKFTL